MLSLFIYFIYLSGGQSHIDQEIKHLMKLLNWLSIQNSEFFQIFARHKQNGFILNALISKKKVTYNLSYF